MKIIQESADFTKEEMVAFAKYLGWVEEVYARDEANRIIFDEGGKEVMAPNPFTYQDFLAQRYNRLPVDDLKSFNLAKLKAEQAEVLKQTEDKVASVVKDYVSVTII